MLYTDCQSGRTAAIPRHVSFAQITCSSLSVWNLLLPTILTITVYFQICAQNFLLLLFESASKVTTVEIRLHHWEKSDRQRIFTSASSSTKVFRGRPTNPCRERRNWCPHSGHSTTSPARLSTPRRSRHGRQNVWTHGNWRGLEYT